MRLLSALVGVAVGMCLAAPARASCDILLDNASVRVSLNTYGPGEISGEHEHFVPRFVYVLAGGTMQSVVGTDPPESVEMAEGSCMYAAPVRHMIQNAGDTTLDWPIESTPAHGATFDLA